MTSPLFISRNGKSFFVSSRSHPEWWLNVYPTWELETSQFMDEHCRPDKISLDIGSWNGVHALYIASISKHVYTLEPDPLAFQILKENLACNLELSDKITALPYALSNHYGVATIMKTGASGSSILPSVQQKHSQWETTKIKCLNFQSLLEGLLVDPTEIGFIKMDVEGAEILCIPDMEPFLKEFQGAVCLSLHPGILSETELQGLVALMGRYFKQLSPEHWVRK